MCQIFPRESECELNLMPKIPLNELYLEVPSVRSALGQSRPGYPEIILKLSRYNICTFTTARE